jgi:hypothetical protein
MDWMQLKINPNQIRKLYPFNNYPDPPGRPPWKVGMLWDALWPLLQSGHKSLLISMNFSRSRLKTGVIKFVVCEYNELGAQRWGAKTARLSLLRCRLVWFLLRCVACTNSWQPALNHGNPWSKWWDIDGEKSMLALVQQLSCIAGFLIWQRNPPYKQLGRGLPLSDAVVAHESGVLTNHHTRDLTLSLHCGPQSPR